MPSSPWVGAKQACGRRRRRQLRLVRSRSNLGVGDQFCNPLECGSVVRADEAPRVRAGVWVWSGSVGSSMK